MMDYLVTDLWSYWSEGCFCFALCIQANICFKIEAVCIYQLEHFDLLMGFGNDDAGWWRVYCLFFNNVNEVFVLYLGSEYGLEKVE